MYPGAALGYRAWSVQDYLLTSITMGYVWIPGTNKAECQTGHVAPQGDCGCGLYAYHSLAPAKEVSSPALKVVGSVVARGRVRVHHTGWRGHQAHILALMRPQTFQRASHAANKAISQVAAKYQVPIFDTEEELISHSENLAQVVPFSVRPSSSHGFPGKF